MKNWTVRKRVIAGIVSVLVIMTALSLLAAMRLAIIQNQAGRIGSNAVPGLYLMSQIDSISRENVALVLKHVITKDPTELKLNLLFLEGKRLAFAQAGAGCDRP